MRYQRLGKEFAEAAAAVLFLYLSTSLTSSEKWSQDCLFRSGGRQLPVLIRRFSGSRGPARVLSCLRQNSVALAMKLESRVSGQFLHHLTFQLLHIATLRKCRGGLAAIMATPIPHHGCRRML